MITAREIREIKFSRTLGGYKTSEVDDFLDRCADAVEELLRINAENERKLQVLADTVVDYRNQEDSIRSALISAQRMSESVISDARKQADDIRAAAQAEADAMHETAVKETAAELEELRRIRQEVADFKAKLLAIYREHLTLIGILDGGDTDENEPDQDNSDCDVEPSVPSAGHSKPHDLPDFSGLTFDENEE
ncbi:MAG: DivIVA domain-containing protein [Kiritimatiellae bacterium]|nr:DivIVA domain-containing protein [Kiritimatiellia bacterium]